VDQVLSLHYAAVPAQPCDALEAFWLPRLPPRKQRALEGLRHSADRTASVLGIALLERACAYAGVAFDPSALQFPARAKPFGVVGHDFSISHAGGFVGCVLGGAGSVGFDWEAKEAAEWSDVRHLVSPAETDRLRSAGWRATAAWVAMEAIVKAAGVGIEQAGDVRLDAAAGHFQQRRFYLTSVTAVPSQVAWVASAEPVVASMASMEYRVDALSAALSLAVAA
jgi:phosphopantetheinyl transferase